MDRIGLAFLDRPELKRALNIAKQAETLGYESIWVCETRLARDAISIMGALAATTDRIKLGSGIVNTWTRGPALMAVTFATLDELALGRMLLGLGSYWDPLAWKQGIERRKLMTQMREYVEVTRRLLNLERFTFEGEVVAVRDLELDLGHGMPREPKNVPIYIGATGFKMMEMAGEIADGVLINGLLSYDYVETSLEHIRVGAERVGRKITDLDNPYLINIAMDRDGDKARDVSRRLLTMYLGQQPHIGKASGLSDDELARIKEALGGWPPQPGGIDAAKKLVSDEVVNRLTIAGTPDECRAALKRWSTLHDCGASYPVVVALTDNFEEIVEELKPQR